MGKVLLKGGVVAPRKNPLWSQGNLFKDFDNKTVSRYGFSNKMLQNYILNKGTFINDVPRFLAISDLPTYLPTLSYSITSLFGGFLGPPTYPNMGHH